MDNSDKGKQEAKQNRKTKAKSKIKQKSKKESSKESSKKSSISFKTESPQVADATGKVETSSQQKQVDVKPISAADNDGAKKSVVGRIKTKSSEIHRPFKASEATQLSKKSKSMQISLNIDTLNSRQDLNKPADKKPEPEKTTKKSVQNEPLSAEHPKKPGKVKEKKKRKPRKKSKSERPKLCKDVEVVCNNGKYTVLSMLGSGGFGDVYKVRKIGTNLEYAMKTEVNEFNGKKIDRLKLRVKCLTVALKKMWQIEVTVMNAISEIEDSNRKRHFVEMVDRGKTQTFKLVVMQLLGPSIYDLRRYILCIEFTRSTAMRVTQQALQSIWDLHLIGYLHKDIKPQNFAIGIEDKAQIVYIFDLGMAHKFIDSTTNKIKPPRAKVRFVGTVKYASRNCHLSREQSRKDDLESWIYMSTELFTSDILPWRRITDRQLVLLEKEKFFLSPSSEIYSKTPEGFRTISKYIDKLAYEDEPNYKLIQSALDEIIQNENIDIKLPCDWVGHDLTKQSNICELKVSQKGAGDKPMNQMDPISEHPKADAVKADAGNELDQNVYKASSSKISINNAVADAFQASRTKSDYVQKRHSVERTNRSNSAYYLLH